MVSEQPCICGHDRHEHRDTGGRCTGHSIDKRYGTYACVCPYYTQERT